MATWEKANTEQYMLRYSVCISTNTGKASLFLQVLQWLPWMSAGSGLGNVLGHVGY